MTSEVATDEPSPSAPRPLYRLSVAQYEKMIDHGVLTKRDKIELIEGLLVERLPKTQIRHMTRTRIHGELVRGTEDGWLSAQKCPVLLARSEPEPDIMVMRGPISNYHRRKPNPADVALVVEVSDLLYARDVARLPMFAEAGIPAYWIANIPDRKIEVYADPVGTEYRSRGDYGLDAEVPLILDGREVARLPVRDLLPPPEKG